MLNRHAQLDVNLDLRFDVNTFRLRDYYGCFLLEDRRNLAQIKALRRLNFAALVRQRHLRALFSLQCTRGGPSSRPRFPQHILCLIAHTPISAPRPLSLGLTGSFCLLTRSPILAHKAMLKRLDLCA